MRRTHLLWLLLSPFILLIGACAGDDGAPVAPDDATISKPGTPTTPNPVIAMTERYYRNPKTSINMVSSVSVMNADGGAKTRLYTVDTEVRYPAWSPDGRKIAFCQLHSTEFFTTVWWEIMVMDVSLVTDSRGVTTVQGTNVRRLTNGADLGRHYIQPTWGENSSTIYFTTGYINNPGENQTFTTSIHSVSVNGGPIGTVYTTTNPMSDYYYLNDLVYNIGANEFAVRRAHTLASYNNGQWLTSSGTSELALFTYDATIPGYTIDATRSWGSPINIDWSHSGQSFIWDGSHNGTNGTHMTANAPGSTPRLVSTTARRPAFSPQDTKYVGLNSTAKTIVVVDFSTPTPTETAISTLGPTGDAYASIGLSWKRSQ